MAGRSPVGWVQQKYSRRIGAALFVALAATVGFAGLFAASAAQGEGTGYTALAGTVFVLALHVGLLGIVLGGNASVELRKLTEAADAIEAGDFGVSPETSRSDEFGRLAASFDTMRTSLDEAFTESEQAQREAREARERAEEARAEAESARADAERRNEELLAHADDVGAAMAAAADGDFTHEFDADTDIEAVERIANAYDEMAVGLSGTVTEILDFAAAVEDASNAVAEDAADVEQQHAALAADIRDLADDIGSQADQLDQVVTEANNLSATIEEVAATTDEVAERSNDAAAVGESGAARAEEAVDAIEEIAA
ncbi:MAG: HAMP domain-containing protein, partial [Halobacterium sp.]